MDRVVQPEESSLSDRESDCLFDPRVTHARGRTPMVIQCDLLRISHPEHDGERSGVEAKTTGDGGCYDGSPVVSREYF